MTPSQRGHRDAAQLQDDAQNPFDPVAEPHAHDLWHGAKARVDEFRAKGRDPNGHPPAIPHLCERDVSKVCNCCDGCKTACWAEGFEGATERIKARVTGAKDQLIKLGLGLVRRVRK